LSEPQVHPTLLGNVVFQATNALLELDHAFAQRPGHFRQLVPEQYQRDHQDDEKFRRTETEHGTFSCEGVQAGGRIEGAGATVPAVGPLEWMMNYTRPSLAATSRK